MAFAKEGLMSQTFGAGRANEDSYDVERAGSRILPGSVDALIGRTGK
jgi:hypothetical protein